MKRALLLVSLLAAFSCGKSKPAQSDGSPPGAVSVGSGLTKEQSARVLATVGSQTITVGDFMAALEHMDSFDRLRYQSVERRKELLNEMINVLALAEEAREKGYDKDPLVQQELRAVLREAVLKEVRAGLPTPGEIPETEVRAYYEANRASYRDPEKRRASILVLRDEGAAREALSLARKAATAAEWGELVRKHSVDPQARAPVPVELAGDVGMATPPGDGKGKNARLPESARETLFKLDKVGEVAAEFVRADGKFYIVRLTQKVPAHERTYEESERTIRIKLSQDKMRARDEELLAKMRKEYPVTIDEAVLREVRMAGAVRDAGAADAKPEASARR